MSSRARAPQVRATYAQWNAMRATLGSQVPDKHVYELLRKHGDDTKAAFDDFYGPSSSF